MNPEQTEKLIAAVIDKLKELDEKRGQECYRHDWDRAFQIVCAIKHAGFEIRKKAERKR